MDNAKTKLEISPKNIFSVFFVFTLIIFGVLFFTNQAHATVFVNDTFTDTAGTTLVSHAGEMGATWTHHPVTAGTAQIDSAGRLRSTFSDNFDYYASGIPASADYDVEWDVHVNTVPSVFTLVAAFARFDVNSGVHYEVWYDSNGLWSLYRYTSISSGVIISSWQGTITAGSTYHAKFSLRGSSLTLYVDGTQRIAATNSVITVAGSVGLEMFNTATDGSGIVLDNFSATDAIAATSYTFIGPTVGAVNSASIFFTVTPNGPYTGTITPSSSGSGVFTPTSLAWSGDATAKTFTYTPSSTTGSPHIISVTSSPMLTDPASISYIVDTSFVNDTFTDTAGTTLASHIGETGATWTNHPSYPNETIIDSAGRIRNNYSGHGSTYYSSGVPFSADYIVQTDVTLLSSAGDYMGILGRMSTSSGTFYWFDYSNIRSKWELLKSVNNIVTSLAENSESFGSTGTTHTLQLSMIGSTISGYSDGVLKVTATDSAISSAGRAGIVNDGITIDTTGQHQDNFMAFGSVPVATSYTLTGPTSGTVSVVSTNFAIAPNGTYTGTITPSSSGTGVFTPTSLTWSGDATSKTFTYTPSNTTNSPHTISVTSSPGITDPTSISYTVNPVRTNISVNNSSLYWSRDNVYINASSYALMLTPGSYLKTNFSGTSVDINLDVSVLVSAGVSAGNYPIVRYQIDNGSWTSTQLTPTITALSVSGLSSGTHLLRFEYVSSYSPSNSGATDKWLTPVGAIKVTNLSIDDEMNVSTPTILSKLMRVDGDSITEGLRAIDSTDAVTGNSGVITYAYNLAGLLNTELVQLGYGSQGWLTGWQGNIPTYPNAVDYYYNGVSRLSSGLLAHPPDYWLINQGENDGGDVTSAAQTRLGQARTEAGAVTQIFLLVPFSGAHRAQLTSAYNVYVAANPTDHNIHLLDLGSISFGTTDGLHPNASGHQTLATALATAINNVLPIISASPSSIIQNTNGNTVTITGTNTSWTAGTPGTPTFTLTGGTGASIISQTIISNTSATLTINAGSATGTLTINDPNNNVTTNIIVVADNTPPSTPTVTPSAGTYNSTQSVTLSAAGSDYIKYSLIETPATCSTGTLYSDSTPISVATSQTIYVRACDNAGNSSTENFAYIITTNSTPVVSAVSVSGSAYVGETLTGLYTYSDADNDLEGASTFRWLRNDVAISNATALIYTTVFADLGKTLKFEVTPVATSGTSPGTAVASTGTVIGNTAPVASSLSISGSAYVRETLTGTYTYSDADGDLEGTSTYRWLRNDIAITGATALTYTTVVTDLGTTLKFEVTPVALTGTTTGTLVSTTFSQTIIQRSSGGGYLRPPTMSPVVIIPHSTTPIITTTPPTLPITLPNRTLEPGNTSTNVLSLQNFLYAHNYLTDKKDLDGIYGPRTKKAFTSFVLFLQNYLYNHNYLTNKKEIDGFFGPRTRKALISFQKDHNLVPDGIVGPLTRGEMNK